MGKRMVSVSAGQQFWEGPSFSRQRSNSLMCSEFCWHSAYALAEVMKIGDGTNQTQTGNPQGAAALRAAVATSAIQSVAATAGRLACGDGWLCRVEGEVIAATDMAVPDRAFMDPVLGPFIEFGIVLSVLPMACIALLALVSGGSKCLSWFRRWLGGSRSAVSQKGVL